MLLIKKEKQTTAVKRARLARHAEYRCEARLMLLRSGWSSGEIQIETDIPVEEVEGGAWVSLRTFVPTLEE